MRAASQLPGRGPTVVDMAPVPAWKGAHCCGYGPCTCTLIKNLMMMMMMMDYFIFDIGQVRLSSQSFVYKVVGKLY